MMDVFVIWIGYMMATIGSFSLGWYWRCPPVYGRVVGVANLRCDDAK